MMCLLVLCKFHSVACMFLSPRVFFFTAESLYDERFPDIIPSWHGLVVILFAGGLLKFGVIPIPRTSTQMFPVTLYPYL
ncbi:hypothetical protein L211DRAFT_280788 [Terfezia boudieri ATCC MYA-4762]|uniref:Uncharacterized protein n=1 Tax=Terfezia boudieri ATCC MYA-4762 TaxID=1051890 RepID=A0A3N4LYX5_9PEZI|nr:hypothetical protein L211DRAFT_280788 [Terfezia boudieri ATCC MYA-4762]